MKSTEELQRKLYGEMLSRIQEDDSTAPVRDRIALVLPADGEGKQYPILCRKPALDAAEQVILDLNALAAGKKFLAWAVGRSATTATSSPTRRRDGLRQYDLHVRDLRSGADGRRRSRG